MFTYIYPIALLVMIMLIYEGLTTALKYAPIKIKAITIGSMLLILLRYLSLFLLLIYEKMQYVYLLKPFIFLELIYMPIVIFICVYIFSRNDKIKLNFFYVLSVVFLLIYFILIVKAPLFANLSSIYGYSITLKNGIYSYLVLLSINSFVFVLGFKVYSFKYADKLGATLLIIASLIAIFSIILSVINSNFVGMIILGEVIWVIVLDYGLRKFIK